MPWFARSGRELLCAVVSVVPALGADVGGGHAGVAHQVSRERRAPPLRQGARHAIRFEPEVQKRVVCPVSSDRDWMFRFCHQLPRGVCSAPVKRFLIQLTVLAFCNQSSVCTALSEFFETPLSLHADMHCSMNRLACAEHCMFTP